MEKIRVGIMGATGTVGQRFIELLQDHPWFEIAELAASDRSAGKPYEEAVGDRWKMEMPIPGQVRSMSVKQCRPELDCPVVFSALDADVAGPIEEDFAREGYIVFSNSRNHRMDPDVPLLVPEVNYEHLEILSSQKQRFGDKGRIITNPNCSTIGLVLALAPLHKAFGLKRLTVTTLQALSGAGYPGVPSMEILDNVLPLIGGEEGKMESEPLKILGSVSGGAFSCADIKISAACNRVGVKDGHLECVSVELDSKPTADDIIAAWESYNPLREYDLPFSPPQPIVYHRNPQRPQPRFDRDTGSGMACVTGRLRECPVLDYKFIVLSHNTIRGAAGASILNAELARVKKIFS